MTWPMGITPVPVTRVSFLHPLACQHCECHVKQCQRLANFIFFFILENTFKRLCNSDVCSFADMNSECISQIYCFDAFVIAHYSVQIGKLAFIHQPHPLTSFDYPNFLTLPYSVSYSRSIRNNITTICGYKKFMWHCCWSSSSKSLW